MAMTWLPSFLFVLLSSPSPLLSLALPLGGPCARASYTFSAVPSLSSRRAVFFPWAPLPAPPLPSSRRFSDLRRRRPGRVLILPALDPLAWTRSQWPPSASTPGSLLRLALPLPSPFQPLSSPLSSCPTRLVHRFSFQCLLSRAALPHLSHPCCTAPFAPLLLMPVPLWPLLFLSRQLCRGGRRPGACSRACADAGGRATRRRQGEKSSAAAGCAKTLPSEQARGDRIRRDSGAGLCRSR